MLYNKLKELMEQGFEVRFLMQTMNLRLDVRKQSSKKLRYDITEEIPLEFATESKIGGTLSYMKDEIEKAILHEK